MARNGADVVLCQHSHCIGVYEKYEDCHILYGQGNFHFIKDGKLPTWYTAFAVKYDTKSNGIVFIPVRAEGHGISLAKNEDKEKIMSEFEERTDVWRELFPSYKSDK